MASRSKIIAISLSVSLTCLTGLYAYAWSVSPRDARIGELGQEDIGAFVRIRGHVKSVTTFGSGGARVDLMDYADYSSIPVYLSANAFRSLGLSGEIRPGALLELAGEVEVFGGEVEVSVQNGGDVRLIAGAEENRIGLGTLARNPESFVGMTVVVLGLFSLPNTIVDWSKLLAVAGSDKIWVDHAGGGHYAGKVDIFGKVLFNEERRRFEVKVAGGNDSVSPHGQMPPAEYENAPLNALAKDPESWDGRSVAVLEVTVMAGEVVGTSFTLSDVEEGNRYTISCMVFGWDSSTDGRGVKDGSTVEFLGTWNYYSARGQWQITSDRFTIQS